MIAIESNGPLAISKLTISPGSLILFVFREKKILSEEESSLKFDEIEFQESPKIQCHHNMAIQSIRLALIMEIVEIGQLDSSPHDF